MVLKMIVIFLACRGMQTTKMFFKTGRERRTAPRGCAARYPLNQRNGLIRLSRLGLFSESKIFVSCIFRELIGICPKELFRFEEVIIKYCKATINMKFN